MEIVVEDIRLVDPETAANPRIKAFATILVGDFLVVMVKVVRLPTGRLHVGFPDRPVTAPCPDCGGPNILTARYCHRCGELLPPVGGIDRDATPEPEGYFQDLCHPAHRQARLAIENVVLRAYCRATADALAGDIAKIGTTPMAGTATHGNGRHLGEKVTA